MTLFSIALATIVKPNIPIIRINSHITAPDFDYSPVWAAFLTASLRSFSFSEFGFAGTFREVQPRSRLVHTEMFDPGTIGDAHPQSEAIVTVTFAGDGDMTLLDQHRS